MAPKPYPRPHHGPCERDFIELSHRNPPKREAEADLTQTEEEAMWLRGRRAEGLGMQPEARAHRQPQKLGEARESIFLGPPEGVWPRQLLDFRLQATRLVRECLLLSQQVCGSLLQ